jgi:N-acetylglucosamine-6-phosphate deacetylase
VLLGIDDRKGSIEPGKEADLILLDQDYHVIRNLKQDVP